MERVLRRKSTTEWCEVVIKLGGGRLSVCGSYGEIISRRQAKSRAFQYWEDFFNDNRTELADMALRFGTRNAKSAARKVLAVDGEFHGLDVHCEEDGKVFITDGGGQCIDEMKKWFPEVEPLLPWHLNDMHAECEHQENLGWKYETHEGQKCPECGYLIGSQWLKRELPHAIVVLAGQVCPAAAQGWEAVKFNAQAAV